MRTPLWFFLACLMSFTPVSQAIFDFLIKKKLAAVAKAELLKSPSYIASSNFKDFYTLDGLNGNSGYVPPTHGHGPITSLIGVPENTGNFGSVVNIGAKPSIGSHVGSNFGITQINQGGHTSITGGTSTFQLPNGSQGGNIGVSNQGTGNTGSSIIENGQTTVTGITGPTSGISVVNDDSTSVGNSVISSGGGGTSSGGGGNVVSVSLGQGTAVCPAVTVPVVEDTTMAQYSTEYVTVPQQITSYVFTTVPFQKSMLVTQTVLTTITEKIQTGLCTRTDIFYITSTLKKGQVVEVTQSLTHTDLIQTTHTLTNTRTEIETVTKIQTNKWSVYKTVAGSTRTITHLTTTTEYVTNTKVSEYDVTQTTVEGVPYPIWVTTTELAWLPHTVTKTINRPKLQTVFKKCGY